MKQKIRKGLTYLVLGFVVLFLGILTYGVQGTKGETRVPGKDSRCIGQPSEQTGEDRGTDCARGSHSGNRRTDPIHRSESR